MLTDITIRQAKFKDKPYKLSDSHGLYLLVSKAGKYWRMNYRFLGKQRTLSIGVYPEVILADARKKCDEAHGMLKNNIDPSAAKRINKHLALTEAENTFKALALEWHTKYSKTWASTTAHKIKRSFEMDI